MQAPLNSLSHFTFCLKLCYSCFLARLFTVHAHQRKRRSCIWPTDTNTVEKSCKNQLAWWCALRYSLLHRSGLQSSALPDAKSQQKGHWKWCTRKQKRGKMVSVCARLKTNASCPALPSIILSNVWIINWTTSDLVTWFSDTVLDTATQLDSLTLFRVDRNVAL